jgi:hypothetical protein
MTRLRSTASTRRWLRRAAMPAAPACRRTLSRWYSGLVWALSPGRRGSFGATSASNPSPALRGRRPRRRQTVRLTANTCSCIMANTCSFDFFLLLSLRFPPGPCLHETPAPAARPVCTACRRATLSGRSQHRRTTAILVKAFGSSARATTWLGRQSRPARFCACRKTDVKPVAGILPLPQSAACFRS